MTAKSQQLFKNCKKLKLYFEIVHKEPIIKNFIISIMSVDVFGKTLVRAKEIYQGPQGVGSVLTEREDFDNKERRLCNEAPALK